MVITLRYLWFSALTMWPFIFIRKQDYSIQLLNHEYVHLKQQQETFVIFGYLIYVSEWFVKLIYYRNFRKAYRAISFEREAIAAEPIIGYCGNRKSYTWVKFIYISDSKLRTEQWRKNLK